MIHQPPLICSEFGLVPNLGAAGICIIASGMMKSYTGSSIIDGFSIKDPLSAVMDIWWMMRKVLFK